MSKLYTEEEVRDALEMKQYIIHGRHLTNDEIIYQITPIELPTDEEIEKESYKIDYGGGSEGWIKSAFRQGAKWMRDKIKGGEDE